VAQAGLRDLIGQTYTKSLALFVHEWLDCCAPQSSPCRIVFDFLSQQDNKLCHFVWDIVDSSSAGEDRQQTNHLNDQAGDLP